MIKEDLKPTIFFNKCPNKRIYKKVYSNNKKYMNQCLAWLKIIYQQITNLIIAKCPMRKEGFLNPVSNLTLFQSILPSSDSPSSNRTIHKKSSMILFMMMIGIETFLILHSNKPTQQIKKTFGLVSNKIENQAIDLTLTEEQSYLLY